MNIWSGQKRPGLSFGRSSIGAPADEQDQHRGRQPDVDAEEPVDRQRADPRTVLEEEQHVFAEDRRGTGDLDRDLRCEQRVEVPRQQVAGETEHERHDEQNDADDPLQLARLLVGAPQQHLQHVHHQERDHRGRAPIMQREHEMTGGNLVDDVLGGFPRRRGRR
jgi:hypothetical protein